MKKPILLITSLLMAAAVITGCTKTEDPVDESLKQGEATLARIMDFKSQMEEAKANPNAKSSTYMSVADAVWNVEALFNLTYAYPEYNYGRTVACDTTLHLPVSSNDSVLVNDLSAFYGQMFDAVQAIYQSVDLDNKQFLILDVEAGERHGSLQAMKLHTVQGSVRGIPPGLPQVGPFASGEAWKYGEKGGMRDASNNLHFEGVMDASDTLTRMLNYWLVPQAPNNYEYVYTDIVSKQSVVNHHHIYPYGGFPEITPRYCEFYKEDPSEDDYWLDSYSMNYYYFAERYLVLEDLPNDAQAPVVPSGHSFFQVVIGDYKSDSSPLIIYHLTKAFYGHRTVMGHEIIERENL